MPHPQNISKIVNTKTNQTKMYNVLCIQEGIW